MQRLHERSAKDIFIHDAFSWMRLVHWQYPRTRSTDSGYPLVIMVESTHSRKSNYLAPCMMRGMSRTARFRKLLPNPLMRSCPVEVHHILIEHALEPPLAEDQQMVKTFLSHTPQEGFTLRIGSWRRKRRFENLDGTRGRHPRKTWSKFAIVITNQILRCLPIRCSFSELLRNPGIGRRSCHAYVDHLP
jgi:hypothetical protein